MRDDVAGGVLPLAHSGPARRLTPVSFSTDGEAKRHRLDAVRSRFAGVMEFEVAATAGDDFPVQSDSWAFGNLVLTSNVTPVMTLDRQPRHARRDGLDHWVIRVGRSGRTRSRYADATYAVGPMQPFLFSMSDAWRGDWTEAEWLALYMSRDAMPELSAGLSAVGTGPVVGPGASLLADFLTMVERRLPETEATQAAVLAEATRSMIRACLLSEAAPRQLRPGDVATAQLERARAAIRQNIGLASLGPWKVCQLTGMSRSALYRLFEPHGGVAQHIQAVRMRVAHGLLSDPATARRSIAAIAEEVGIFDPSTFSRVFRRVYGYSPSEARAAALSGLSLAPADLSDGCQELADFTDLLRRTSLR